MRRAQMRAARAMLGWSQDDLAREAGVSAPTIKRIEPGDGYVRANSETLDKIEDAFRSAGLVLLDEYDISGANGFGVRFRNPLPETLEDIIEDNVLSAAQAKHDLTMMVQSILSSGKTNDRQVKYAKELLDLLKNYDQLEDGLMSVLRKYEPEKAKNFEAIREAAQSAREPKAPDRG